MGGGLVPVPRRILIRWVCDADVSPPHEGQAPGPTHPHPPPPVPTEYRLRD